MRRDELRLYKKMGVISYFQGFRQLYETSFNSHIRTRTRIIASVFRKNLMKSRSACKFLRVTPDTMILQKDIKQFVEQYAWQYVVL